MTATEFLADVFVSVALLTLGAAVGISISRWWDQR